MDEGEKPSHTQNNNPNKPLSPPFLPSHVMCVLHTGHCNKHACTCTACMIMHSGSEEEKKKGVCVCVAQQHGTAQWLAGNQRTAA